MSQQKINTIPYCYKNTGGLLFIYEIQKKRQKSLRDRLPGTDRFYYQPGSEAVKDQPESEKADHIRHPL